MESFPWGKQFITGIPAVDQQHQTLVHLINTFGEAIAENTIETDLILTTFSELAEYARIHFQTEEDMMHEIRLDPRHLHEHLSQHNDFVDEITSLAKSIDPKNSDDCRMLFEYLIHWLVYHIIGCDMNMARQVAAIQDGETCEAAYIREELDVSAATEPLLVALNGLFSLVSKRNRALCELNRTLEERVAKRTQELAEANESLLKLSVTDHLTQLPNRRYAMQQLELLWQEAIDLDNDLSCLLIDADNFKAINDTCGHDAGDVVLQHLARQLRHAVRSDDIVCRLGGDEFIVLCPDTNLKGALQLGEEIKKQVNTLQIDTGAGYWQGSVSIGVGAYNDQMTDIRDLIKAADDGVYTAKKDGRNCVRGCSWEKEG